MKKSFVCILLILFLGPNQIFAISPQADNALRKARAYLDDGNIRLASQFYRKAKNLDSEASEVILFGKTLENKMEEYIQELSKKAFVLMQQKDFSQAEVLYREILLYDPNHSESLDCLKQIKETKTKIKEYNKQGIAVDSSTGKQFDLDQYSAISEYNRAYVLFNKGERKKALVILNEILEKDPFFSSALKLKEEIVRILELEELIEKAESSFHSESLDSVVEAVTELLSKAPDKYEFYLLRARAYIKKKDYVKAEKDLFSYYKFTNNKEISFSLLSDCYALNGKNLMALAFAYDNKLKEYTKPFMFIVKNYFYSYFWENILLLVALIVMLPITIVYTWQIAENLFSRLSVKDLFKTLKCFFLIATDQINGNLKDLMEISRHLNYPWTNYFFGLVFLDNNDLVKAQRFFKFATSSKRFKGRAYYFHGVTCKLLKQKAYESDFEEATLALLDNVPLNIWRPKIMKKLEERLMNRFSVPDNDSLESMSYKLLNSII